MRPRTSNYRSSSIGACLNLAFVVLPFVVVAACTPSVRAAAPAVDDADGMVSVTAAPLATMLTAVKAPGARAVLVNVWATWCEPCRDEMPDLLRFYRENRARGLRLVMIAADDEDRLEEVRHVLSAACRAAGLGAVADLRAFIKREDDTAFVNGLDRRWSGALPATFLFTGRGARAHSWLDPVTHQDLVAGVSALLTATPTKTKTKAPPQAGREP